MMFYVTLSISTLNYKVTDVRTKNLFEKNICIDIDIYSKF
jgi:hypothetical protein